MEEIPFDILDDITNNCITKNTETGFMNLNYHNFISCCKHLYRYSIYRKKNLMIRIKNKEDIIKNDNIELTALYIHNKPDIIDKYIQLSLLNGSINISWWIWTQHRPYLTIQILMDIEQKMLINCCFTCNEITYRIIKTIQCAHEVAYKRS